MRFRVPTGTPSISKLLAGLHVLYLSPGSFRAGWRATPDTATAPILKAVSEAPKDVNHPVRQGILQTLSGVEDVVYVGLGLLLTIAALTLLIIAVKSVAVGLWNHGLGGQVVSLLDQILLVLLIIELLYTVQVSFRERGLVAEPFLVVALIAVIRRILVLTAEAPKLPEAGDIVFRRAMLELAVLTVMVIVLVSSLILLQKHAKRAV
jgi:uncharacterized membrane protein (DUF373 family)